MAQRGIHATRNMLFGTWEESVCELPRYMVALVQRNPDNVVESDFRVGDTLNVHVFNYKF